MKIKKYKTKTGFTLIETLIAIGIFVAISVLISGFLRSIFFINTDLNNSLSAQFDARQILRKVVSELRSTSPSSLGAYPLVSAGTTTLTFYSDIDSDGLKDKVRYFIQSGNFKRGVVKPTGPPFIYIDANESLSTVASNVTNSTNTPIFEYFDDNYTGTSSPLTYPLNILNVRLVRITLIIEKDSNRLPIPFTINTQVMLRNLKDNL